MHCIVKFVEENNSVAVVPACWILEGKNVCLWPPGRDYDRIQKAVQKSQIPDYKTWSREKIVIVKEFGKF